MEQSTELALTNAWSAAWADFLVNKVAIAERRAAPWLAEWPPGSAADADALLMLADLAHISGAVREALEENEIDDESINLSTLESSFNDKMTELVTDAILSAPATVTHKHGKHHSN